MSQHNLLDALIAKTTISKKITTKQQKIAQSAIKMFAEKGYANTSTSEIAKDADVAEGTIFRHYGTKENLLLAILLPFIKESLPSMAENVFQQLHSDENIVCFEDFIRAFLQNRLEFIEENKEIFQVLVKELLYNEVLRNELLPYFSKNVIERFTNVIGYFKEQGELNDISIEFIQRMLFTFFGGYFISRFVFTSNITVFEEENEIENVVSFIINGLKVK